MYQKEYPHTLTNAIVKPLKSVREKKNRTVCLFVCLFGWFVGAQTQNLAQSRQVLYHSAVCMFQKFHA